jgi:hypothetical protein
MSRWMMPWAWTGGVRRGLEMEQDRHTILEPQNHVAQPAAALLLAVGVSALVEANLHNDALLAHLHDHVERVFLGVVEDFNEGDEVGVVQLLHNGNLLLDELKGSHLLDRRLGMAMQGRVEANAGGQGTAAGGGAAQQVGLGALAQARL